MNIANALTVLRLMLVPVFVVFLVTGGSGWRTTAFVTFAVASVTDLLDGELARRRNLITDFGKIADPIADKALTGSALVTLSVLGELPWWVTVLILARELLVTALRFWVIRRGVIAASRGGKIKTMLQVIAISLYILPLHIAAEREALMGAAVVVTIATGVDYVVRAVRLHRAVPGRPAAAGPDPPATGSGLAGSGLAGSGLAGSGLAGSGLAGSGLAGSGLAGAELAGAELAGQPMPAGPAGRDQQSEQAESACQTPNLNSATGDFAPGEPGARGIVGEPPTGAAGPGEPARRPLEDAGAGEENSHDG
jgi:CDP-diacylglycerol---glycerol-3-phosphate 3-phosphatidyltransferase